MRPRRLETVDELLALLAEQGVHDAPPDAPDSEALRGFLALVLHVAEHGKRISFPGFDWTRAGFLAADEKIEVDLPFARLGSAAPAHVVDVLAEAAARARRPRALVALDARASGLTEYELTHLLYGEVTLFAWPRKPPASRDPRVEAARQAGWTATLKEHNLLPGRGLVVPDGKHGRFLTDPLLEDVQGAFVLLPAGYVLRLLNPFAARADALMEHWLSWGRGMGASEWIELLHVERLPEEP